MNGATAEQQDAVAAAARKAGGYFELIEVLRTMPRSKVTYTIDPKTRKVKIA